MTNQDAWLAGYRGQWMTLQGELKQAWRDGSDAADMKRRPWLYTANELAHMLVGSRIGVAA